MVINQIQLEETKREYARQIILQYHKESFNYYNRVKPVLRKAGYYPIVYFSYRPVDR